MRNDRPARRNAGGAARRIVVVGGGVSGLAAARAAVDRGRNLGFDLEVLVLEREDQVGGKARTFREDGWLLEAGPGSFLDGERDFRHVVRAAGLESARLAASEAAERRYLVRDGELREVPTHPLRFAASGLLGPMGLLRVLVEPLIPAREHRRRRGPDGPGEEYRDESVWEFAARRLGEQVADRLVSPMVLGIYAGDARRLSLPAAMPRLARLEEEYGSLVAGMFARRKAAPESGLSAAPSGQLSSFRRGLQSLPLALAATPRIDVRCGATVTAVTIDGERSRRRGGNGNRSRPARAGAGTGPASAPVYRVHVGSDGEPTPAAAVVLAGEAFAMADLLEELAPRTARALATLEMPAVTVVGLGYGPEAREEIPPGFGVLVPRGERIRTLGCVWDSYACPDRAPGDHVLVRAMLGGTVDPEVASLDEAAALELARREMAELFRLTSDPVFARAVRWRHAIPQYDLHHSARVRTAREELALRPGLYLAGNSLAGVSFARSGATGWRLGGRAAEYVLGLQADAPPG